MDLSINFECSQCRELQPLKIVDLSLGGSRLCHQCGAATELTEAAVAELARHLRELP